MARLDRAGQPGSTVDLTWCEFVDRVRKVEQQHPRWVWADTSTVYPRLLRAGVTVALNYLEKRGLISLSRKQIVITERNGLKAAANGTYRQPEKVR